MLLHDPHQYARREEPFQYVGRVKRFRPRALGSLLPAALAFFSVSTIAPAQSLSADDLSRIRTSLTGKMLPLRGYPWDSAVSYRVEDQHLKVRPTSVHQLSVFSLDEVRQKNGYLELHGRQTAYVRVEGTQSISPTQIDSPVVLVIYLQDVLNITSLVDHLESDLFYETLPEAVAGVPPWQQACVPQVYSPAKQSLLPSPSCRAPAMEAAIAYPKLIKQADPEFPNSVRSIRPGGWQVLVALSVNEKGLPENVHVLIPSYLFPDPGGKLLSEKVGKDLDSSAVSAVKQYRFRPALKDGQAVRYELLVAVHFQTVAN